MERLIDNLRRAKDAFAPTQAHTLEKFIQLARNRKAQGVRFKSYSLPAEADRLSGMGGWTPNKTIVSINTTGTKPGRMVEYHQVYTSINNPLTRREELRRVVTIQEALSQIQNALPGLQTTLEVQDVGFEEWDDSLVEASREGVLPYTRRDRL